MMKFRKMRMMVVLFLLVCALPISSVLSATTYNIKKVDIWYDTVKMSYNGKDVTADANPFVIYINGDGKTFVPLAVMSNIFNKNVEWDGATATVMISDKSSVTDANTRAEIAVKDQKIKDLEARVKDLEDRLAKSKYISIDDLEYKLNSEYYRTNNIRFRIDLSGDTDELEVRFEVNLSTYQSEWNSFSKEDKEDYIEKVVKAIRREYPDVKISGSMRDPDKSGYELKFTVDDDDEDVSITTDNSTSLNFIENKLNDQYADYFEGFRVMIDLDGTTSNLTYYIKFNLNTYREKWELRTNTEIERGMSKIYDYIRDQLGSSATIEGYFYDTYNGKNIAKYYRTVGGSPRFERY